MIAIYFVYGLAFYSMGLAIWVESGRSSKFRFTQSMRLLAAFGLLHGIHEWMDMVNCGCSTFINFSLPQWFFWLRLIVLILSFVALIAFGEHMLHDKGADKPKWRILSSLLVLYTASSILSNLLLSLDDMLWRDAMDVLARYILGIPGALVACLALWKQRQLFIEGKLADFVGWLNWAIVALLLYGILGQLFPNYSPVFPAQYVNSDVFLRTFGFPVQLLRTVLACVIAISMIQVLRVLEVENQETLRAAELKQRRLEQQRKAELEVLNAELVQAHGQMQELLSEVRQRDAQRGEMLKHVTSAQEAERQRIARELHDDIGQVLTGMAMGLRGLSQAIRTNPDQSIDRLGTIEHIATNAIRDLRHLINDLRPPQLDDMGLVAALRSMTDRFGERSETPRIALQIVGEPVTLLPEVEITLYRIAQEAVTNAVKYAVASQITITLQFGESITLAISDDGRGFDVESALAPHHNRSAWGLYGIMERARLIDGISEIDSVPGEGTTIKIQVQLQEPEGAPDDTARTYR